MIELPEAIVIARQMNEVLRGKRVENALRGNSPHKFAFYNRPPEEYAALLKGRTMGEAYPFGACIVAPVEPEYALMLGGGGERIHVHREESALPKKHQLLLRFDDGAFLSVTVQGWGCAQLFHQSEVTDPCRPGEVRVSPASDAFTYEYFRALLAQVPEDDSRSVKFVVISRPGVWGIGNGTLQDILFRAGLHPRRRAVGLSEAERRALYEATRHTVQECVAEGGRDTELDLYGNPGGYHAILDRRAKGCPCQHCGTPIEAISYLGGTCYLCPRCQALQ